MAVVAQVDGFGEFRRSVKAASGDLDKELSKALRAAVGPIVADARARFNALPGTGSRTARQVRGSATRQGANVVLASRAGYEFGREFGSKGPTTSTFTQRRPSGPVEVTRTFDYSKPSVFGPWTGNRFTLPPGPVSGNAFFPAAAAGGAKAVDRVWAAMEKIVGRMGGA